ncbi:hypothetical protein ISN45_At05g063110 [Arabidopsis thaliana x Arabidopsis arenosa]|uniref:Uncharacterized protein n=3 Tax=Arabidopsis TaxID=3701 RepID=B3H4Z3_ARATH|nr:uncharacterized protein AT5G66607 [Arabidopsis thaliana]AED98237.1 hypothetical protein AT5G66607 [Arabidopsis thaliana]KAG7607548.1 hypothetical protein ISN45_At05g063110 [Arabidopsis thaliana x Arabidopsis arenosa]CAA0412489.1 unnamed protein product [Arabidopsis thaliana]|eukprot:NP_001119512.1 hypothetical protein AT5G66607 [Arabidopsis thaliana]
MIISINPPSSTVKNKIDFSSPDNDLATEMLSPETTRK